MIYATGERREKIAPFAMFEQGIAKVARGNDALGQSGNFAFFFFNNFIQNIHVQSGNLRKKSFQHWLGHDNQYF